MKTLISMTDFVLKQKNDLVTESNPKHFTDRIVLMFNYAEFLKQPLTLGMFVPCVEGEPIEYFELKKTGGKYCQVGSEIEKKAKEKVLFEGEWKVTNYKKWNLIESEKHSFSFYPFESDCLNIEKLIEIDLQLTESAIKQIGL